MRASRHAAVLLVLVLAAQPMLVLVAPGAHAGGGGERSGGILEVTTTYTVSSREEWDGVSVGEDATLRVVSGGVLLTGSMSLHNGSRLHIIGGTLAILVDDYEAVELVGIPYEVVLSEGGILMVEGAYGNASLTRGWDSPVRFMASHRILLEDSLVLVTGGNGHSLDSPATDGTVHGHQYSGGDATLVLEVDRGGTGVSIIRSSITVSGGEGGDAPDGGAPQGDQGGGAGGYTAGGNVSDSAGRGGDASMLLRGDDVEVLSSLIDISGGDGGDAGDGGPGGLSAGGGGGGYSGGAGAGSQGPAGNGGIISGDVGSGGDAGLVIDTDTHVQLGSSISVRGGNGGDAGDGGDADVSRPDTSRGGGGGGGYSSGGGGATGPEELNDGGSGGYVSYDVASGGDARLTVDASTSTLSGGELIVVGGPGGTGGFAGASQRDGDGWHAGGGGGSYSAGGGAGTSATTGSAGTGGHGTTATGRVGSGGDAELMLEVEDVTLTANTTLSIEPGDGGVCWRADADGVAGGQGRGLLTRDGYGRERVPLARTHLLSPEDGDVSSGIPMFSWAPVHDSTTAGAVMGYEFQMDDDPGFMSTEINYRVDAESLLPTWVPNFTSYWRVRALYERPWYVPGPWSEARSFTYINMPPVISATPVFDVLVSQVTTIDLSPFVSDPDDAVDRLSVVCDHPNVLSTTKLNITLHFPEELGSVPLDITVSDALNRVQAQLMLSVLRYRHSPLISGLTNHKPPLEVRVYEGTEAFYDIMVHDVDSDEFTYWTTGTWEGATTFPNGTLRIRGGTGDVGDHVFTLHVADEGGREASMRVYVEVLNVNDPPDRPSIVSPGSEITVRVGEVVSFSAVVSDPDLRYGQVLNVTFISNATGVIREVQTTTLASMSYDSFEVGQHVVTIVVSDGQYFASDQVVVNVEDPPPPPPVTTGGSDGPDMWIYVVASVVLFAVGYSVGHLQMRRRGSEVVEQDG